MVPAAPCRAAGSCCGAAGVQRLAGAEHGHRASAPDHQQRGGHHAVHRRKPEQGGILRCGRQGRGSCYGRGQCDRGGHHHRHQRGGHGHQPAGPAQHHHRPAGCRQQLRQISNQRDAEGGSVFPSDRDRPAGAGNRHCRGGTVHRHGGDLRHDRGAHQPAVQRPVHQDLWFRCEHPHRPVGKGGGHREQHPRFCQRHQRPWRR